MDGLLSGWIVEMPTIADSLFHTVINATSSPTGVEGGNVGEPRSDGTL